MYRHAEAFGLKEKRARNLRAPLETIIEQASDVKVSAAAVIQAVGLYARINSRGQFVEPGERVSLHEIFDSMSEIELQAYAEDGTLPEKLRAALVATPFNVAAKKNNG